MAVGLSDGTSYNDSADWFASAIDKRTDKQRSDQTEINANSTAGDFQSRFYASDASTMPVQASTELAGALKSSGGREIAARGYDTRLSPEMEEKYSSKFGPNDSKDYDMRGWFQANPDADPNAAGVHYPDTFKKPNHPTFSDQSIYHGINGNSGGTWGKENGQDTFTPGITNLENMHPDELKDYFKAVEPDAKLKDNPDILGTIRVPGNKNMNITMDDVDKGINVAMAAGPGTMAGVTSKTLDKGALEVAQAAEKQGLGADEIWQKTGFFRGTDKRWRYEIDDSGSALKTPEFKRSEFGNYQSKLGDVLDHPELYKAYPGIENVPVNVLSWYPSKGAFWNGSSIGLGKEASQSKSTLMHEVQHAIQDREAFAQGGTPGKVGKDYKLRYEEDVDKLRKPLFNLQDKMNKGEVLTQEEQAKLDYLSHVFIKYAQYARAGDIRARENYLALAGETEARNVETRLPLEPKDRAKISPLQTEDTLQSEQMVTGKPTLTTPYKGNDGFLTF